MLDLSRQIAAATEALQRAAAQGVAAGVVLSRSAETTRSNALSVQTLDAATFRLAFASALDALSTKRAVAASPTLFLVPPRLDAPLSTAVLTRAVAGWSDLDWQTTLSFDNEPLLQICRWSSTMQLGAVKAGMPATALNGYLNAGHIRAADHGIFARGQAEPDWFETLARFGSAETGFQAAGAVLTGQEPAEDLAALDLQMLTFALERLAADATLKLSVNASRASLNDPQWRRNSAAQLARVSPSLRARLAIEVTETPAPLGPKDLRPKDLPVVIGELAALGVRVWLDDIGTGVTALNEMRIAGVAGIKLDRTLSQHAFAFDDCFGVMSQLAGFAARRGLDFIVEGVENTDQRQRAEAWGASHVQGFFAGQPTLS